LRTIGSGSRIRGCAPRLRGESGGNHEYHLLPEPIDSQHASGDCFPPPALNSADWQASQSSIYIYANGDHFNPTFSISSLDD
jgi:hypothetical protein